MKKRFVFLPAASAMLGLILFAGTGCDTKGSAEVSASTAPTTTAPTTTAPTTTAPTTTTAAMRTVTIAVEGMTCDSCEQSITKAMKRIPGVRSCIASHLGKIATIEIANAKVSDDLLVKTIVGLGYKAQVAKPKG